jgi:hypothetical protein
MIRLCGGNPGQDTARISRASSRDLAAWIRSVIETSIAALA